MPLIQEFTIFAAGIFLFYSGYFKYKRTGITTLIMISYRRKTNLNNRFTVYCKLAFAIFLCLFVSNSYAQEGYTYSKKQFRTNVLFGLDSSIVRNNKGNEKVLNQFIKTIIELRNDTLAEIEKITISSYCSPEASRSYNKKLAQRRTKAVLDYLNEYIVLPDSLLTVNSVGIDWVGLRRMVLLSDMKLSKQIIHIIDNVPDETWKRVNKNDRWLTLVDSRRKHLQDLGDGSAYRFMEKHFFPLLRSTNIITIYYTKKPPPPPKNDVVIVKKDTTPPPPPNLLDVVLIKPVMMPMYERIPILAFKTNLLFDALTVLNIEVEVPIGKRWSLAADWTFPWWLAGSNDHALELLLGSLEPRFWFGNREDRDVMTGWFASFYLGAGLYDFEFDGTGDQGEFIHAGLGFGYAHKLSKDGTWRMEYALGAGFLATVYRHYIGILHDSLLLWQYNGKRYYLGPTKAEISLVWMIHRKRMIK